MRGLAAILLLLASCGGSAAPATAPAPSNQAAIEAPAEPPPPGPPTCSETVEHLAALTGDWTPADRDEAIGKCEQQPWPEETRVCFVAATTGEAVLACMDADRARERR